MYSGRSDSFVNSRTLRATEGSFTYEGITYDTNFPDDSTRQFTFGNSTPQPFPSFTNRETSTRTDPVQVDGVREENNRIDDLHEYNATLGMLWTLSRHLSLGATVDLPGLRKPHKQNLFRQKKPFSTKREPKSWTS
ncbi:MAG: hypothetical protein GKR87_09690 [Kiritimatiellae bacterium]|nr:hypothetical protein [Kiritimatiellia bacterium]